MQSRFLPTYQALKQGKQNRLTGLWLLHGDEPLVLQWFIDACRPLWQNNHQTIKRLSLNSPKDWQAVTAELGSLSLFGEDTALIVSGKQKCPDELLAVLAEFGEDAKAGNSGHCLIYELPKQDKKAQNTKLFKTFLTHGRVVDCHVYDEKDRRGLLTQKADELGLTLDPHAWQMLLEHTENHLLAAHQALWRLADLHPNHPRIDSELLKDALVSDYQYSVFNLCDTLLLGNPQKALQILDQLRQTDTAPTLVLWGIAKEARTLLQLKNGKSMNELGIWQSKTALYRTALNRQNADKDADNRTLSLLYTTDQAIKGINPTDPWQLLRQLCLMMCGVGGVTMMA